MSNLHILDHPLITHKLSIMRNKKTGSKDFRELLEEIAMLMGYELTRDLPLGEVTIETPLTKMKAKMISGKKLAIVPILRAGAHRPTLLQSMPACVPIKACFAWEAVISPFTKPAPLRRTDTRFRQFPI